MDKQSLVIAIFSFAVLLLIALLFLYLHLRGVRDELVAYWKTILDKMRIRNDMIPNLIETIRKYTKNEEKLLMEMAQLRAKSWPMEKADVQKVNVELSLTHELHDVWKLPQKYSSLNVDTNFLSLKKDFHDLGKEIDGMVDVYNKKIRGFNGRIGFILVRPFFALMRLKKFPVFEFEP
jgi:LemA protein